MNLPPGVRPSKAVFGWSTLHFVGELHAKQTRKYTGLPYITHLLEVAGIVAVVAPMYETLGPHIMVNTALLHDSMEDQGVSYESLRFHFGAQIADGVRLLSDMERGGTADRLMYDTVEEFRNKVDAGEIRLYNRAERHAMTCERLSKAPGWIQSIKCADLISNTRSILQHDPEFAKVYLPEKRELLGVMTQACSWLWDQAMDLASRG